MFFPFLPIKQYVHSENDGLMAQDSSFYFMDHDYHGMLAYYDGLTLIFVHPVTPR